MIFKLAASHAWMEACIPEPKSHIFTKKVAKIEEFVLALLHQISENDPEKN